MFLIFQSPPTVCLYDKLYLEYHPPYFIPVFYFDICYRWEIGMGFTAGEIKKIIRVYIVNEIMKVV